MDPRERLTEFVKGLPVAHRVVIGVAGLVLVMAAVLFFQWLSRPSYTVLYSNLDEGRVAEVVEHLESQGVSYELEAGGSRVLVPREQLHRTRADLAAEGVSGTPTPPGYEVLEDQGLSVSDFRQRVDFRRAMEGELARTLAAMDRVEAATVHLNMPERALFEEDDNPPSASVMLAPTQTLTDGDIEAVVFLVASAVESLEPEEVTVADVDGTVLHAPGDGGGPGGVTNRQLRHTREFEHNLAGDIGDLLERLTGDPRNSVVVRAELDFDERVTESETYNSDESATLREQTVSEIYEGTGGGPVGGPVGVDGGPLPGSGTEADYERDEEIREFGVDRIVDRTVSAPGEIETLSVAIVMDDGSISGAPVPPVAEVEELVSAALGLQPDRGDALAVTAIPFPAVEEPEEPPAAAEPGLLGDLLPRVVGVLVLLLVAVALLLMTRGRREPIAAPTWTRAELTAGVEGTTAIDVGEPAPVQEKSGEPALQHEVQELVQRQPEEIAGLLRSWLAETR